MGHELIIQDVIMASKLTGNCFCLNVSWLYLIISVGNHATQTACSKNCTPAAPATLFITWEQQDAKRKATPSAYTVINLSLHCCNCISKCTKQQAVLQISCRCNVITAGVITITVITSPVSEIFQSRGNLTDHTRCSLTHIQYLLKSHNTLTHASCNNYKEKEEILNVSAWFIEHHLMKSIISRLSSHDACNWLMSAITFGAKPKGWKKTSKRNLQVCTSQKYRSTSCKVIPHNFISKGGSTDDGCGRKGGFERMF